MTPHQPILDYDCDGQWSNSQAHEPATPPKPSVDVGISRNHSPERNPSIECGLQSLRLDEHNAQEARLHVDQVKDIIPFWRDAMIAAEHGETLRMEPFLEKLEREYEERQKNDTWGSDRSWGNEWNNANMWHVQTNDDDSGWGHNMHAAQKGDASASHSWASGLQRLNALQHIPSPEFNIRAGRGRYRGNDRRPSPRHDSQPRHGSPLGSKPPRTHAQEEMPPRRGRPDRPWRSRGRARGSRRPEP